jgi:hypothetical protein
MDRYDIIRDVTPPPKPPEPNLSRILLVGERKSGKTSFLLKDLFSRAKKDSQAYHFYSPSSNPLRSAKEMFNATFLPYLYNESHVFFETTEYYLRNYGSFGNYYFDDIEALSSGTIRAVIDKISHISSESTVIMSMVPEMFDILHGLSPFRSWTISLIKNGEVQTNINEADMSSAKLCPTQYWNRRAEQFWRPLPSMTQDSFDALRYLNEFNEKRDRERVLRKNK